MANFNTLNEALYKMSNRRTLDDRRSSAGGSFYNNPTLGGGNGGGGDADHNIAVLLSYAMAQVALLQQIRTAILQLHSQQQKQFEEQKKRQFDSFQVNNRTIQQVAGIGSNIAGNRTADAAAGTMNLAADLLPKAIGKVAGSFATLIAATSMLTSALIERGRELAGFSGAIAGAEARADVKRLMADLREARALGGDYAKLIEKQVDLEVSIRDAIIPIKQFMLENLSQMIDDIKGVINSPAVKAFLSKGSDGSPSPVERLLEAANVTSKFMRWDFTGGWNSFKRMIGFVEEIKNNTAKDPVDDLFGDALNIRAIDPFPNPNPAIVPINQQLNIPLIGGI